MIFWVWVGMGMTISRPNLDGVVDSGVRNFDEFLNAVLYRLGANCLDDFQNLLLVRLKRTFGKIPTIPSATVSSGSRVGMWVTDRIMTR